MAHVLVDISGFIGVNKENFMQTISDIWDDVNNSNEYQGTE